MVKNQKDRTRKLQRYYKAALDLLRNSQINPDTIASTEDQRMLLYRFYGVTKTAAISAFQVKERDIRTKRKRRLHVCLRQKATLNQSKIKISRGAA